MANRVIIGDRDGSMGMWVSRPGRNVFTASGRDLLFVASNSQNTKSFQVIQTGGFWIYDSGIFDLSFPYVGILPAILLASSSPELLYLAAPGVTSNGLWMTYLSSTVARFTAPNWALYGIGSPQYFTYQVTNVSNY